MARVTVEDCIEKIPNRFQLVLTAAERARLLDRTDVESVLANSNDKNTVIALREIAEGVSMEPESSEASEVEAAAGEDDAATEEGNSPAESAEDEGVSANDS